MTSAEQVSEVFSRRPKRADARRNYETLISAARDAFAEDGVSASLEDIARRAHVGIGTLYRHFPTRQDLFESVYVDEVEALCRTAGDLADQPPWDALVGWLHRFVRYTATKRALAEALNRDSELFRTCRTEVHAAGEPLLRRAQQAGVARADASFDDVMRLVGGITMIHFAEPGQLERVVGLALDGLRPQPPSTDQESRAVASAPSAVSR
ncbi:TetR/AcrR family transcriptional regulator [Streptosporangium sp. 'caverna']|uniref:TetR/AcrR family transcriptional regulator n=1 Tax=Streptosporangium sp. 'caverna' TaxID=2202249 RepID=UPI000D7E4A1C|nr:TetR/AcrR family transcriptional regulator [Streptosporangium sp. 'caverna']AWS41746.1 TetR family transcriptional regulator [Streptosporangium sp. 'caverna']